MSININFNLKTRKNVTIFIANMKGCFNLTLERYCNGFPIFSAGCIKAA